MAPELVEVIQKLLNASLVTGDGFRQAQVAVCDYNNPAQFNTCWSALAAGLPESIKQVLIVWDATPFDATLGPVSTTEHVSPIHWAVCAAWQSAMRRAAIQSAASQPNQTAAKVERQPTIQVCILDLSPATNRPQYLYQHYLDCDKSTLPWLRVIQAADLFEADWFPRFPMLSRRAKQADDHEPVESNPAKEGPSTQSLEKANLLDFSKRQQRTIAPSSFCKRVREELTSPFSPDDRHAVANIVGPLFLLKGEPILNIFVGECCDLQSGNRSLWKPTGALRASEGKGAAPDKFTSDHRCALNQVFLATELLPPAAAMGQKTGDASVDDARARAAIQQTLALLPARFRPRVTLLDDQWHHGWYEWLKSFLPCNVTLNVCANPEFLLGKLEAIRDSDTDMRFGFELNKGEGSAAGDYADILLLDLRLFSGDSRSEAAFYNKLLPLCRKFEEDRNGKLVLYAESTARSGKTVQVRAWKGFASEELDAVERWIEGGEGRTDTNHQICLTLLPRLVALADFSLPIIIFSSTGQARIRLAFSPYESIIAEYEKPRMFSSTPEDVRVSSLERFCEAMLRAKEWLCGAKCIQPVWKSPGVATATHRTMPTDLIRWSRFPHDFTHFEVYLDESGTPDEGRFCCGGLLVGYKGISDADGVHADMQRANIVWTGAGAIRKRGATFEETGHIFEDVTTRMHPILGDRPVIPITLFRYPPPSKTADSRDLLHPDALDNMFLTLVRYCLEVLLFEVLPCRVGASKYSVSTYIATRTRFIEAREQSQAGAENEWKSLRSKWGLKDMSESRGASQVKNNVEFRDGVWWLKYQSLDNDSALAILSDVLGLRPVLSSDYRPSRSEVSFRQALGISLRTDYSPAQDGYNFRHVHYVADYVVNAARLHRGAPEYEYDGGKHSFLRGDDRILMIADEDFLWLLDAGRRTDASDVVGAMLQLSLVSSMRRKSALARLITEKLKPRLEALSGHLFAEYVRTLNRPDFLELPLKPRPVRYAPAPSLASIA